MTRFVIGFMVILVLAPLVCLGSWAMRCAESVSAWAFRDVEGFD